MNNNKQAKEGAVHPGPVRRKSRRLLWGALIAVCALAILFACAVWYISSESFFRKFIVPRVEKATGRSLEFERADVNVFRGAVIDRIVVGPKQGEERSPFESERLVAKWKFWPLLKRRIHITYLSARGAKIFQRESAPAQSVGSKPRSSDDTDKRGKSRPDKSAAPLDFVVDDLSITSSSLTWAGRPPDDHPASGSLYSLYEIEIKGSQLGLGRPVRLDLSARFTAHDPLQKTEIESGRLRLNIDSTVSPGRGAFALNGDWAIERLQGTYQGLNAEDLVATGVLDLSQESPDNLVIRRADMAVQYKKKPGAQVSLKGRMNPRNGDGSLTMQVSGVDRTVLNLLSTPDRPLDFLGTEAEGRFEIERSDKGRRVALAGELRITDFEIAPSEAGSSGLKPAQVSANYRARFETEAKRFALDTLEVSADQDDRRVIHARLSDPVVVTQSSGGGISADSPASLTLKIDRFAMGQLNPLLSGSGVNILDGRLSADSSLSVDATGQVAAAGNMKLIEMRSRVGDRDLGRIDSDGVYDVAFQKDRFSIQELNLNILKDGKPAGHVGGSGQVSTGGGAGALTVSGEKIDLSALQVIFPPMSSFRFESGMIDFVQKISSKASDRALHYEGHFDASNLSFVLPTSGGARFSKWALKGSNNNAFDPQSGTLNIVDFNLSAREEGLGGADLGGKGNLDFREGKGSLSLDVREIDVPFLDAVIERPGQGGDRRSRPTAGVLAGTVNLELDRQYRDLSASGALNSRGLKWTAGTGSDAHPMEGDIQTAYDFSLDGKTHRLDVRKAALSATVAGKPAGSMEASGAVKLDDTSGQLDLTFRKLDTAPVAALLGPVLGDWRVSGGIVDGQQKLDLSPNLRRIAAQGRVKLVGMRLMPPAASKPISPASLDLQNEIVLTDGGKVIEMNRFLLETTDAKRNSGELDVRGRIDLSKQQTALSVRAKSFPLGDVWPVLESAGQSMPVQGGVLSGTQYLQYSAATPAIEAKGNLRFEDVTVQPSASTSPLSLQRLDIAEDVAIQPDKTDVRSLVVSTYSGGNPLDKIEISAQGGGLKSKKTVQLSLKAPSLHLDHFLAMIPQAPKASAVSVAGGGGGAATPAGAQTGTPLPVPPINASISVGQFEFDRYSAQNLIGRVGVTSQGVTVHNLKGNLADGTATATGWLRTDTPKMAYDAKIFGSDMDMRNFLAMFFPGMVDKLSGRGTTNVTIAGMGFDGKSFDENFRLGSAFSIANGRWHQTAILNALAQVTRVPSLADLRFFRIDGQLQISKGVVDLKELMLVGALQKLRTKGTIGFDGKVDLRFDLWLGGELAARINDRPIFKYLKVESDKYLRLPIPIGMGGTLNRPLPSLKLPTDAIIDIGLDALDKYLRKPRD